jgi:hypothetical protein
MGCCSQVGWVACYGTYMEIFTRMVYRHYQHNNAA